MYALRGTKIRKRSRDQTKAVCTRRIDEINFPPGTTSEVTTYYNIGHSENTCTVSGTRVHGHGTRAQDEEKSLCGN